MKPHLDAAIRRSLRPSEQVLWSEGRSVTRATVVGRLAGVALLLAWDVFCVREVWRAMHAGGPLVEEVPGPDLEFFGYMLFGFVMTVMVAVVEPRRDRNLAYVVTNRRVLTFGGFWRPQLERSIPMEVMRPDHVVLGRDGSDREIITFWDHAWTDDDGTHAPSWEQLADAPTVHALILRVLGHHDVPVRSAHSPNPPMLQIMDRAALSSMHRDLPLRCYPATPRGPGVGARGQGP